MARPSAAWSLLACPSARQFISILNSPRVWPPARRSAAARPAVASATISGPTRQAWLLLVAGITDAINAGGHGYSMGTIEWTPAAATCGNVRQRKPQPKEQHPEKCRLKGERRRSGTDNEHPGGEGAGLRVQECELAGPTLRRCSAAVRRRERKKQGAASPGMGHRGRHRHVLRSCPHISLSKRVGSLQQQVLRR